MKGMKESLGWCRFAAIALWVGLAWLKGAIPAGYYDRAEGLSGGPLKVVLHETIGRHTVIPYAQLHAPLARLHEAPGNPNNVILLYSADSVPKGTDFITANWNREHAWPRSRGNADETGPDDSDLHYVWPCYDAVNSTRGNLPYDLSNRNDPGFRAPGHPLAPRTSFDTDSWEPAAGQRGALARSLFYVAVRYDGDEPGTSDMELVSYAPSGSQMGNLTTLLRWHAEEPVTDAERRRNDLIYSDYQRNRNPFIDHPEWVMLIWGAEPGASTGLYPLARVDATVANASELPAQPGEFKITLGQAVPAGGLRINFRLTGTTVAALDYALSGPGVSDNDGLPGGAVTLPEGATSTVIRLNAFADGVAESAETATLVLRPGPGYTVVPNASQAATITLNDRPILPAIWRFDAGAPFAAPLWADTGNARLLLDEWRGSVASFSGVTGDALALAGMSGNGSAVLLKLSMTGYRGLKVSFQTRGTDSGYNSGTWAWSLNGATFTTLSAVNTASTSATFASRTVDFSNVSVLDNAPDVTLRYTLSGATTSSGNNRIDDVQISATVAASPVGFSPVIVRETAGFEVAAGGPVGIFIEAVSQPAPTYQWFKDGEVIVGANSATLSIPFVTVTDEGHYTVRISNALGEVTNQPIRLTTRPSVSRLINVATRALAGKGAGALIAGFVIGGREEKQVLIRGSGPALEQFGVTNRVSDPKIALYQGSTQLVENNDWAVADRARHQAAGAFAFEPGSKDAALIRRLAPGGYTVHLTDSGRTGEANPGVGLLEVFELEGNGPTTANRLINLSTRAFVGTGQDILIPGFVVGPPARNNVDTARLVLIRAIGPGLRDFEVEGVLERPRIRVLSPHGFVTAENTGWQSAGEREALVAATARAGAFALHPQRADSALLLTLGPIAYTVQVSGADGGSGVALVEVYEVP